MCIRDREYGAYELAVDEPRHGAGELEALLVGALVIHGVGVDDRGAHLLERIDDRAGEVRIVGNVGVGHHEDAKRARDRIVAGRRSGIGGPALVDQTAQRALLGGGQRLVVGALGVPGGLEAVSYTHLDVYKRQA